MESSFFPSSTACNPSLTIIANTLRVADHLRDRLGWVEEEQMQAMSQAKLGSH